MSDSIKTTGALPVGLVSDRFSDLQCCRELTTSTVYVLHPENGFRAYNVDPFREFFRNVFQKGGIGIVEMLYRHGRCP